MLARKIYQSTTESKIKGGNKVEANEWICDKNGSLGEKEAKDQWQNIQRVSRQ